MTSPRFLAALRAFMLVLLPFSLVPVAPAQSTGKSVPKTSATGGDRDHLEERGSWFLRGRLVPGKSAAELRHRADQAKMQARATRRRPAQAAPGESQPAEASMSWTPLGPVPLASDATG